MTPLAYMFTNVNMFMIYLRSLIRFLVSLHTVSCSYVEFEYHSLAHACVETTWVCFLLGELGVRLSTHILLHCDNLSATYFAANLVHHASRRHIELDDLVVIGSHRLGYIPSSDNQPIFSLKPFISLVIDFFLPNLSHRLL